MSILKPMKQHWKLLASLGAVVGLGVSSWQYSASKTRLEIAIENLHKCELLASQIGEAQLSPQRASLETWSQDDLGTAIESSANNAQLERDRVLRIDPQAPKRLGKSDYLEQATEVEFSAVTLRQLVGFLFAVGSHDDQLEIRTLRLRVPHQTDGDQGTETWLADVVLTQRIYAPTTPHR